MGDLNVPADVQVQVGGSVVDQEGRGDHGDTRGIRPHQDGEVGGGAVRRRPQDVQRYIGLRDAGYDPLERYRRPQLIDTFAAKMEELVEESRGRIRADVVHDRLRAMGYEGSERTTRRAVHKAKLAYRTAAFVRPSRPHRSRSG